MQGFQKVKTELTVNPVKNIARYYSKFTQPCDRDKTVSRCIILWARGVPLQKVVGINIVINIHNRKAQCPNRNGGSDNHMGGAHTYMHKWVMLWQEEMLFKRPRDFCSL